MKINTLLYYCLIFILLGDACHCGRQSRTPSESAPDTTETFIDSATAQNANTMPTNTLYTIHLKPGLDYKIQNLLTAIQQIKTAKDMSVMYAQMLSVQSDLNESVNKQFEKEHLLKNDSMRVVFKTACDTLSNHLRVFHFSYDSLDRKPYFSLNNAYGVSLAMSTPQKDDDDFFKLLKQIYGDEGDADAKFPCWLIQTTELEGYSVLGDRQMTDLLTKIATQKNNNSNFQYQLTNLYDELIEDMITWPKYGKSKVLVVSELEKIGNNPLLILPSDKERILQRAQDLKSDIQQKKVEYDCEKGNCHYEY